MKCPRCGNADTLVIDSRPIEDDTGIRRRRECQSCRHRMSSVEYMVSERTAPLRLALSRLERSLDGPVTHPALDGPEVRLARPVRPIRHRALPAVPNTAGAPLVATLRERLRENRQQEQQGGTA